MPEEIKYNRRRFLGLATMGVAGAGLGMIGSANAESTKTKSANGPKTKPGTNTSFAPLKQIDAGLLNIGYAEAGTGDWSSSHSIARLALRYLQLRRCCSFTGDKRLSSNRALSARLRHDALSFTRHRSQWPAVSSCCRHHCLDGRAQDREGDHRRF